MLKFGIIGAGRLGNAHAGNIAQLKTLAGIDAQVAAVYDPKESAAKDMHEKYGAVICSGPEELAGIPDLDAVVIASPTYCHQEGIRAAVAADKHIFCEKPLCRDMKNSLEMVELVKKSKKFFAIGFVRRAMAKTKKCKELLDSGLIGRIRFCNVDLPLGKYCREYGDWFTDFDKCGGVIVDMLAHHVDLANWFFGKPERVYADGMLLDPAQKKPSDMVDGIITYKNGVICNMFCTWQRFGRSNELMEIYGEKGCLSLSGAETIAYCPLGGEKQEIAVDVAADAGIGVEEVKVASGYTQEIIDFAHNILGRKVELPGVQDGFNSIEIALGMIESVKTGQVYKF